MTVTEWLLDSDPSIRWQVMRDLTGEPADVIAAERSRVASEGWGARLLALQGADGQWDGGTYFPAWAAPTGDNAVGVLQRGSDGRLLAQPWTATSFSLLLLRDLGRTRQGRRLAARWPLSMTTASGRKAARTSSRAKSSPALTE